MSFSPVLSTALRALAQRMRTLLSLGVMTVYIATLAPWCEQRELVVQTTVNGRDRRNHSLVVGFLAHFTYLRVQITGNETFVDLLKQVTQEYRRAVSQNDFGQTVSEIPSLAAGTYFQWRSWGTDGIAGVPAETEAAKIGLTGELLPSMREVHIPSDFNMGTTLWNTSDVIRGTMTCRAGLYSNGTLERLARALRTTAERFVRDPFAPVWTDFR